MQKSSAWSRGTFDQKVRYVVLILTPALLGSVLLTSLDQKSYMASGPLALLLGWLLALSGNSNKFLRSIFGTVSEGIVTLAMAVLVLVFVANIFVSVHQGVFGMLAILLAFGATMELHLEDVTGATEKQ